jgi:tetratricopeptide (TPR) repeat protein
MLAHHYLQALELTTAARRDVSSFADAAGAALTDAGDRAFGLHAYDAAVRFWRGALDLLAEGDARRGRLHLGLGRALVRIDEPSAGVLERARDELLDAQDLDGAVEAEAALAELHWTVGDRDRAFEHLGEARRLAESLPTSPAKARAAAMASRFTMLAADHDEAIRIGEEALAMASQLGLDDVRAATLNNVGSSRAAVGDEQGVQQLAEAIQVAREANAPFELCRALGNLAAMYWRRGRLVEAEALWRESHEEGERYGQRWLARWDVGVLVNVALQLGRWDEALAGADAFLAEIEAGSPHYLAAQVYSNRSELRLGRGDVDAAVEDAERSLELARRAKDPQILCQALADAAHVLRETGDVDRAVALAQEFADKIGTPGSIGFGATALHVLAWTLAPAGRGAELAKALDAFPDVWARAGAAYGRGDPVAAADICAEIGAPTQEAYARLAAARLLVSEGRRAEADEQLHRALGFYRSVGAKWYVRQGEALLAASA